MHKNNVSDEYLLEQICAYSNDQSLEDLFNRYFQRLCTFSHTFVKDHAIAEELVADTFCTIWFNRANLNLPDKASPYLYKAVRNHSLNHLKKKKFDHTDLSHAETIPDKTLGPEQQLTFNDLLNEVNLLVDALPEKKRIIFRMNKMEGFKYKEIADILGISVHTVQNHMVEAVKILAENAPQNNLLFFALVFLTLS
jgi:RNA polymerase sigma-70 factor (ECF subfamily)